MPKDNTKKHLVTRRLKPKKYSESDFNKPHLPHFGISTDQLPISKDWKIGEKYEIKMVVKQTSIDEHSVGFEILEIGGGPSPSKIKRVSRRS